MRYTKSPAQLAHISSTAVKSLVGLQDWHRDARLYVPLASYLALVERLFIQLATKWVVQIWPGDLAWVDQVIQHLTAAYTQPERRYHNLVHLTKGLELLEVYLPQIDDKDRLPLVWAWLWHDVVYDPASSTNEEQSVTSSNLMVDKAPSLLFNRRSFKTKTARYIMVTKGHKAKTAAEQLLASVDLSILGADPEEFDEYETNIRLEYGYVPDEAFRSGRLAVLDSFLSRPDIYEFGSLHQRFEIPARLNLERARQKLLPV
jgi:predicted metal-dependent HD superfamily phosphohydrolase